MDKQMLERGLIAAGVLSVSFTIILYAGHSISSNFADSERLRKELDERERICSSAPLYDANFSATTIDQLFRDHDGYRFYSREDSGLVVEAKYYDRNVLSQHKKFLQKKFPQLKGLNSENPQGIIIYRDLRLGEPSTLTVVNYSIEKCFNWVEREKLQEYLYLEVHLPENQGLEAGTDHWTEGNTLHPVQKYEPMKQVYPP